MANIIYKTDNKGTRISSNTTGYFQEEGWLIIESIDKESFMRGDYICFSGEELPDLDGIYEILEAESGIYKVNRIKERI